MHGRTPTVFTHLYHDKDHTLRGGDGSLDLYRTTSEGTEWVGSFLDLDVAKAKLMELSETAPGDYSIFDQSTGERLFYQDFS
jgi:hypothetical protein